MAYIKKVLVKYENNGDNHKFYSLVNKDLRPSLYISLISEDVNRVKNTVQVY